MLATAKRPSPTRLVTKPLSSPVRGNTLPFLPGDGGVGVSVVVTTAVDDDDEVDAGRDAGCCSLC